EAHNRPQALPRRAARGNRRRVFLRHAGLLRRFDAHWFRRGTQVLLSRFHVARNAARRVRPLLARQDHRLPPLEMKVCDGRRWCHGAPMRSLLLFAVLPVAAFAQNTTGTLVGTAKDPSGAVIAGVKVRAVNEATGISFDAETNASGDYTIPNL